MAALGEVTRVVNKATSETQAAKRKILLVDDHRAFREGLREFLNEDSSLSVCGEAEDAQKALTEVEACHPDMVITDISLHEENTLRLIHEIKARHPSLPVLVVSMRDEQVYSVPAVRAGAEGFLAKSEPPQNVLREIRRIFVSHQGLNT